MEVRNDPPEEPNIDTLEPGETFVYANMFFMKTKGKAMVNGAMINAVEFLTGQLKSFDHDDVLRPVKIDAKVIHGKDR